MQTFENMKASSKRLLGGEPEEKSTLQEMEEAVCGVCPTISYTSRMIGFAVCLALGFILTLGSLTRSAMTNTVVWSKYCVIPCEKSVLP